MVKVLMVRALAPRRVPPVERLEPRGGVVLLLDLGPIGLASLYSTAWSLVAASCFAWSSARSALPRWAA